MTAFVLILTTILCSACGSHMSDDQDTYKRVISDLHRENLTAVDQCLQVEGVGGAFLDDIKGLTYRFSTDDWLSLEDARQRMVSLICTLLDSTNSNATAQPYFHTHPLTVEQLDLWISSQPAIDHGSATDVALVMLVQGVIHYDIMLEPDSRYEDYHQETFEEAMRIMQGN